MARLGFVVSQIREIEQARQKRFGETAKYVGELQRTAEPGQRGPHSVDDACAFPDQAVTSLINQRTSNEVGHFSFRRFSHVSGMSVPPNEDMQCR
jgi:hypothetical protein